MTITILYLFLCMSDSPEDFPYECKKFVNGERMNVTLTYYVIGSLIGIFLVILVVVVWRLLVPVKVSCHPTYDV